MWCPVNKLTISSPFRKGGVDRPAFGNVFLRQDTNIKDNNLPQVNGFGHGMPCPYNIDNYLRCSVFPPKGIEQKPNAEIEYSLYVWSY
jgi:hypothetical protein